MNWDKWHILTHVSKICHPPNQIDVFVVSNNPKFKSLQQFILDFNNTHLVYEILGNNLTFNSNHQPWDSYHTILVLPCFESIISPPSFFKKGKAEVTNNHQVHTQQLYHRPYLTRKKSLFLFTDFDLHSLKTGKQCSLTQLS